MEDFYEGDKSPLQAGDTPRVGDEGAFQCAVFAKEIGTDVDVNEVQAVIEVLHPTDAQVSAQFCRGFPYFF